MNKVAAFVIALHIVGCKAAAPQSQVMEVLDASLTTQYLYWPVNLNAAGTEATICRARCEYSVTETGWADRFKICRQDVLSMPSSHFVGESLELALSLIMAKDKRYALTAKAAGVKTAEALSDLYAASRLPEGIEGPADDPKPAATAPACLTADGSESGGVAIEAPATPTPAPAGNADVEWVTDGKTFKALRSYRAESLSAAQTKCKQLAPSGDWMLPTPADIEPIMTELKTSPVLLAGFCFNRGLLLLNQGNGDGIGEKPRQHFGGFAVPLDSFEMLRVNDYTDNDRFSVSFLTAECGVGTVAGKTLKVTKVNGAMGFTKTYQPIYDGAVVRGQPYSTRGIETRSAFNEHAAGTFDPKLAVICMKHN